MAFYLIDGLPGTGKTTVGKVLRYRGYEVYDGDEDQLAHWYKRDSRKQITKENEERTSEFLQTHIRCLDPVAIKKLATRANDSTIFITNDPQNLDEVTKFFNKRFALILDEPTRQQRLDERTNNDWGKLQHEREFDSYIATKAQERYSKFRHIRLDASQPTNLIADKIIELASL